MIFGIGTDIAKVSRFEKWVRNPGIIRRFFNECETVEIAASGEEYERLLEKKLHFLCEHYASRFAAKEAFSKALGTGFVGLELSDFGIKKNECGKPEFVFGEKTLSLIKEKCGNSCKIFVSISHEKEYAISYVIIETEAESV
ncbi:holo-ACP synthase [uncultured Treponema sp.]|uniref:holo-ACP synthase n=1 Tax=uncultured Treponema sp. TaxID=162155 RepID=UPI0025FA9071|nr:holo-ACP synthase [uncultured Treponema sp.]